MKLNTLLNCSPLTGKAFLAAVMVLTGVSASAQSVSLAATGTAYTQNFDALSNSTSITYSLTIPGWYMSEAGGGARDNGLYAADNGSTATGDTYSYGATGSTERAFGGLRSGSLITTFGVAFTNNTGVTIGSLAIGYTGEEWRLGTAGRADQLTVDYSTNATSLSTGTWTAISALTFSTPDQATAGTKNGNAASARTVLTTTLTGLSIPNGATFWIRWNDIDASGADDGLAADDFSLIPYAAPATPEIDLQGNGISIASGSTVTSTGNNTNFGSQSVCAGVVSRSFTILNTGAAVLNLTGTPIVAVSGANASDFTVTQQPASSAVAASGSTSFTVTFDPSAAGTRSATLSIANDDADENPYVFTIQGTGSNVSVAVASQTNVSCNGGANGGASITASGGAGGYTYSWAPSGGTAATVTGLSQGVYTVTVTDLNTCNATQTVNITEPSAILTTTSVVNVVCNGYANGITAVSATGGTGPYTYTWSPSGGNSNIATGQAAGIYTVDIRDNKGCPASRVCVVTQPPALVANASATAAICNGAANGQASVSVSGGTPGYSYTWTPSGGNGATATGLSAGIYTVMVEDVNGCPKTPTVNVTEPAAMATATTVTNVSCHGGSNGTASVTVSGGAGGYTYSWTPGGGTAAQATGLAQGSYTVTITDANSCTQTAFATITEPSALSISTTATNVSCFAGATGAASATVSGGTPGYTYSWAPSGITSATATNLTAGNYTVTVTDANACTQTAFAAVTEPTALATSTAVTNVSCNGGSTGSATVTVSGGTPGYTYSWAPSGGTNATAGGLTAGNYTVTVTDGNSCTKTAVATLTQPAAITTSTAVTNVSCNGGSTGSATVTVSGGTPGYTYSWAPSGGSAAIASALVAGNYTLTVTDANSCTKTAFANVTQPTAMTTATTVTNVSCNGGSNGTASVTVSGGTPGYTYSWTPSGGTAAIATGLAQGSYTVTITDANNCKKTEVATVIQPVALTTAATATNVSCNGGANGRASVTVSGGTSGYSYSWAPSGGTAATATGLSAGNYTVTVTDANTCTKTQTVAITEPTALTAATSATAASCHSGANGRASVTVSGGTAGYSYSWIPSGGTAATATGLTAGNYTVTVTDANTCTKTQTVTITEPTAISTVASATATSCNGGANGRASVAVAGGTPGYAYSWAPGGGTASVATGLSAGNYTVTVTDANSCTKTQTVAVTEPAAISAVASATNVSCNGGSNGRASVTVSGGTSGYFYSWAPSGGTAATATGLAAGNYTVTVTDANACTKTQTVTITAPAAIGIAAATPTNVSCNGGANGSASVTVSGGTSGYTYSWAPSGGTAATATGLTAGNYTVTVTDANTCTKTQTVAITQPTAISATIASTMTACSANTGIASLTSVTGGTGAYTYSWTPAGGTAATATGLAAGLYSVTIKDANLCSLTTTVSVVSANAPTVSVASQTNVTCNGASNGGASITATGSGTIAYSWAPSGGTAATATGLVAGTYTVTVTDANNCTNTQTVGISQPAAITATLTSTVSACTGSTGIASVSASGGTGAYTYTWSPVGGNNATATGLGIGIYSVTITDANLCSLTSTVAVAAANGPTLTVASQTNVACFGGNDGAVMLNPATGGTGPYTYSWSPAGGTSTTVTGLGAGTYTAEVTDANSCTTMTVISISQPTAALTVSLSAAPLVCNGDQATVHISANGGTPAYTGTASVAVYAGSYTYTVTDSHGCIATNSIVISQPAPLTSTITKTLCAGQSLVVGTHTYTATGTYTDVIVSQHGCDSTVTTNLTVRAPINVTTTLNGTKITVNTPSATYQWINCDNGNAPISGATSQSFTPVANGHYAVIVTLGGCSATSTCVAITSTGIEELAKENISVYPNPGSGIFTVELSAGSNRMLQITDILGKVVFTQPVGPGKNEVRANGLEEGVYIITITGNGTSSSHRYVLTKS